MNEIVRFNGQPFRQPRVRQPRRRLISFKRVGAALLLIFGGLALVGLVCWLGYGTVLITMRAQGGEAEAQYRLGKHQLGFAGSREDGAQGLKWLPLAAAQTPPRAPTSFGFPYPHTTPLPPTQP